MTTTELIKLLQSVEKGASGKAREISVYFCNKERIFTSSPNFEISSTGDGCLGAELTLNIICVNGSEIEDENDEVRNENIL